MAVEVDLAFIGRVEADDDVEECRLPRTVRADQPRDRPGPDGERASVDGTDAAKRLHDVLYHEDRVCQRTSPRRRNVLLLRHHAFRTGEGGKEGEGGGGEQRGVVEGMEGCGG